MRQKQTGETLGCILKAAIIVFFISASGRAENFDLLIRGGRIIDGTGNPSYIGDIGVRGGEIASMGHLQGRTATRVIEATGLAVTPGFIDIHNHSDATVVEDPDAES